MPLLGFQLQVQVPAIPRLGWAWSLTVDQRVNLTVPRFPPPTPPHPRTERVSTVLFKAFGHHWIKGLQGPGLSSQPYIRAFVLAEAWGCVFACGAYGLSYPGTCVLNAWAALSLYYLEAMIYFCSSHYKILPVSCPPRLRLSNKLTVTENCMQ